MPDNSLYQRPARISRQEDIAPERFETILASYDEEINRLRNTIEELERRIIQLEGD